MHVCIRKCNVGLFYIGNAEGINCSLFLVDPIANNKQGQAIAWHEKGGNGMDEWTNLERCQSILHIECGIGP